LVVVGFKRSESGKELKGKNSKTGRRVMDMGTVFADKV
jgi:hypothetical protein